MVDQSEGASPTKHEYVTNGASRDPCCDVCGEEWGDPIHTHNRGRKAKELPTRQADWEAGRDAAALEIEIEAASEYRSLAKAICKRIRALSYPGPSGATKLPEIVSPTEQLVTCKGQPEPHIRIHACREPIVEVTGPSGAQDAPHHKWKTITSRKEGEELAKMPKEVRDFEDILVNNLSANWPRNLTKLRRIIKDAFRAGFHRGVGAQDAPIRRLTPFGVALAQLRRNAKKRNQPFELPRHGAAATLMRAGGLRSTAVRFLL